jgi:hypothetical protein
MNLLCVRKGEHYVCDASPGSTIGKCDGCDHDVVAPKSMFKNYICVECCVYNQHAFMGIMSGEVRVAVTESSMRELRQVQRSQGSRE